MKTNKQTNKQKKSFQHKLQEGKWKYVKIIHNHKINTPKHLCTTQLIKKPKLHMHMILHKKRTSIVNISLLNLIHQMMHRLIWDG